MEADKITETKTPEDDHSFDAFELADAILELGKVASDEGEAFPYFWIILPDGRSELVSKIELVEVPQTDGSSNYELRATLTK